VTHAQPDLADRRNAFTFTRIFGSAKHKGVLIALLEEQEGSMRHEVTRWVVALFVVAFAGLVATPGCRIQLCKGDGCGGGPDVGGWGGGWGGSGNSGGSGGSGAGTAGGGYVPTQEEQAAIDAAENLDPQVRALNSARAGFVGYAVRGLVEEQIGAAAIDVQTLDVNTLAQMFEDAAAPAWDATNQWISTLDPAQLATPSYPIKVECLDPPLACRSSISCDFAKVCVVDDCGDGKCQPCPDKYGLGNLVTSGWCSYVCYVGPDAVGVAVSFKPRIGESLVPWVTLCFKNQ
jgi:hypothetical protein